MYCKEDPFFTELEDWARKQTPKWEQALIRICQLYKRWKSHV